MNLTDEIRQVLKLNDPDYMEAITEIKQCYVSQGVPIKEIRKLIRKVIHENNQPKAMPEPEAPQPVTPEPPQAVQDKRTDKELSRRVQFSGEPVRERKDKYSTLTMH